MMHVQAQVMTDYESVPATVDVPYTLLCCFTWVLPLLFFILAVLLSYAYFDESRIFSSDDSTSTIIHLSSIHESACHTMPYVLPCPSSTVEPQQQVYFDLDSMECHNFRNLPVGCLPKVSKSPKPPNDVFDCVSMCKPPAGISKMDPGCYRRWLLRPCEQDDMQSAYYDVKTRKCETTRIQGTQCYSVPHAFPSDQVCQQKCPAANECSQTQQLRACKAMDKKRSAFYNPFTGQCQELSVEHLCLGGDNRFSNFSECESTCLRRSDDDGRRRIPIVLQ
ncbi:uncharacterized protein LOC135400122 isoform X3 [Ornithodoros turicata]|uniref:uncharacterized protein LOC135400122 isoform X3 n=1 Tax=Ornithodoros turicata TaxID=34597 RepID=UPI003139BD25